MSSKTRKKALSLKAFKQRVGCMLESMTQLDSAEQSEAYGFLQNCVNILGSQKVHISCTDSDQNPDSHETNIDQDNSLSQSDCPSIGSGDDALSEPSDLSKNFSIEEEKEQQSYKESKIAESFREEDLSETQGNSSPINESFSEDKLMLGSKSEYSSPVSKSIKESKPPPQSGEPYICSKCGSKIKTSRAMLSHLDRHVSTPISCRTCRKVFNSSLALNFHYDDFCVKKHICPECDEAFSCRTHFNNHVEGHQRNNCRACPALFTNRKHLVVHMAGVHGVMMLPDAAFACSVPGCDRRFVKRSTLHRHMQLRHTTENQRVCITCGLYLEGEDAYKTHVETHQQWSCKHCSESFTRRQQYLVHMASHEQSKYRCLTCDQTLPTKLRLLEHRKDGHEVEGLPVDFSCDQCDQRFITSAELREHSAIHKTSGAIQCKYCSKTFSTRKAHNSHKRKQHPEEEDSDDSEASLICEQCGKQFRQPCLLAKHLKNAHNEQTFSCTFCEHKTNNEVNLRRHLALHTTQEQQYVCDQCGASFQALSTLKDHNLFVHSDERNFTCDICKKSFKRKNDLTRHFRSHSDDRSYVCHCKQAYKFMAHLRRHQEAAHKTVTASRKVERLVLDSTGKLVQRPKMEKKSVDKEKRETVMKVEPDLSEGDKSVTPQPVGHPQSHETPMQLLSVNDHQVVALSVTDLQITEQHVDPFNIQVAYDGLSFSDTKAQLVYTTSSPGAQVMSLQLPQFELVEPNLSFDANSVMNITNSSPSDISLASSAHPHGPMLMSAPVMSIASSDHSAQPVMTLITGLEHNAMFTTQADIGTMTEHTSVYTGGVMEHAQNSVSENKPVNTYSDSAGMDLKTSQADMSTMTDMYSSVFSQPEHHELTAMSFTSMDQSPMLLSSDSAWHISPEPVNLPQYSTC